MLKAEVSYFLSWVPSCPDFSMLPPLAYPLALSSFTNLPSPGPYAGLDRFEARKALWADMGAAGLVLKEEPHTLRVPRSQASTSRDRRIKG